MASGDCLSASLPARSPPSGHVPPRGSGAFRAASLLAGCPLDRHKVGESLLALTPLLQSPYGFSYACLRVYALSLINRLCCFEWHLVPVGTVKESVLHQFIKRSLSLFFFLFNTCVLFCCAEFSLLS